MVIEINEVTPMLNGKGGLKRMHFSQYIKLREKWHWLIRSKMTEKFTGRVIITYTRCSVVAPDWDNLYASFKPIGDGLVSNGVIQDDNPKVVTELRGRWQKAKNNKELKTIIEINEISPTDNNRA